MSNQCVCLLGVTGVTKFTNDGITAEGNSCHWMNVRQLLNPITSLRSPLPRNMHCTSLNMSLVLQSLVLLGSVAPVTSATPVMPNYYQYMFISEFPHHFTLEREYLASWVRVCVRACVRERIIYVFEYIVKLFDITHINMQQVLPLSSISDTSRLFIVFWLTTVI